MSLVEAGALLTCRKRRMLSGLKCVGRGIWHSHRTAGGYFHKDSSQIFWFHRNFFRALGII